MTRTKGCLDRYGSGFGVDGMRTPQEHKPHDSHRGFAVRRYRLSGIVPDMACVIWGGVINGDGYGVVNGRYAHRLAWEDARGEIPDGLQIDHLCRNRACVNVAHLELVTQRTNILRGESPVAENARKTHCIHGHEFTPENTYLRSDRPNPARACRECMRRRDRERYARRITQNP